jgi:ATP-dependent helicase HepA
VVKNLNSYYPGQRFISKSEPELGLGKITSADRRFVEVTFTGNCIRKYAADSPPLNRIIFKPGDSITDSNGNTFKITEVKTPGSNGIITYISGEKNVSEDEISESCTASTPLQRLFGGISDKNEDFRLRADLLKFQSRILQSPIRGFVGNRIQLLPHQLFIAGEISSRRIVRVLLADETGLGKTIEACLILHRLILTGRVKRCLVCVPDTLIHQWFVELLRRFNLMFRLFTKEHFDSCTQGTNPFSGDQLGICGIQFLSHNAALTKMAVDSEWDMIIVDEAHHLHHDSPEYECVRKLSEKCKGLILLTATPEQLGKYDHFLRLRLLDPDRYPDFKRYGEEALRFGELSQFVNKNIGSSVNLSDKTLFDVPAHLIPLSSDSQDGNAPQTRQMTLMQIIDRFGIGRAMFRNTRKTISGFPQRIVHIEPLNNTMQAEAATGKSTDYDFNKKVLFQKNDPVVVWLTNIIKTGISEKFLVICAAKEAIISLNKALMSNIRINIALFHEDMTLVQRDRNAAWFAEENGAQVLLCSEIGGEGRNFQFCRNLVLPDLPADPEVLEQRIGRIDRIGQKQSIHIYVPYIKNSQTEILCRWYNEGLDAFRKNEPAAGIVGEKLRDTLNGLLAEKEPSYDKVNDFIGQTAILREKFSRQLMEGRDRLLEISSFRPEKSSHLLDDIAQADRDNAEKIILRLFKHYGLYAEEAGVDKWTLITGYVTDHRFPLPRQERPLITFNRETALEREDMEYISMDHPMLLGGLDLFLSSDCGTSVFAELRDPDAKELLLESVYVIECVAPENLFVDRFLPPSMLRIIVNHRNMDVTANYPVEKLNAGLSNASIDKLLAKKTIVTDVLPAMLEATNAIAVDMAKPVIKQSMESMTTMLTEEISRLRDLQRINASVPVQEIEECELEKESLKKYINNARVRLDSIRVIWHGKT